MIFSPNFKSIFFFEIGNYCNRIFCTKYKYSSSLLVHGQCLICLILPLPTQVIIIFVSQFHFLLPLLSIPWTSHILLFIVTYFIYNQIFWVLNHFVSLPVKSLMLRIVNTNPIRKPLCIGISLILLVIFNYPLKT